MGMEMKCTPVTVNLVKFCHDYLADREIVRIFVPNQLLLT